MLTYTHLNEMETQGKAIYSHQKVYNKRLFTFQKQDSH
jgi:hypothetical protein